MCADQARLHQHRALRPRTERNATNAGPVHGGFGSDIWVCCGLAIGFLWPGANDRCYSFFMAIGTTIRTDSSPAATEAFAKIHRRPMILPRRYQFPQASREDKN
jgi:hypothetical protein